MRRAVLVAMAAAVLTAPVGAVSASGSSAVSAALMLEKGVDRDLYAVGLTRASHEQGGYAMTQGTNAS